MVVTVTRFERVKDQPEFVELLCRQFRAEGRSLTWLAKEHKRSAYTIRKLLIDAGLGELVQARGDRHSRRTYRLTDEQMVTMYRDGASIADVADAAGCGRETVHHRLRAAGLRDLLADRRGSGQRKPDKVRLNGPLSDAEVRRLRRAVGLPEDLGGVAS